MYYTDTPVLTYNRDLCPGDFQIFTCEIRDSSRLVWKNDQYIGANGSQLEFLSDEPMGTIKFSDINSGVSANLTENFVENGVKVLKCQLIISKLLYHTNDIEVICINVDLKTKNSFQLRRSGKNEIMIR